LPFVSTPSLVVEIPIALIDPAKGVNEMVRRRVGFGSAVYIRRIIT
jgi:hypothetical protein